VGISIDVGVWARGYVAAVLDRSFREDGLGEGRTQSVSWAGKTMRFRVRRGRSGPKLELLPGLATRVTNLLFFGFIGVHWLFMCGGAIAHLVGATRAEILDPAAVGGAAVFVVFINLLYMPFMACVLECEWSFEHHVATERLNLVGISFWARTHTVIGASDARDRLVLRTANGREIVVATGWGSESESEKIPSDLSRLIATHLGVDLHWQMSTRMGTR
jgi:hypothetical protein